MVEYPEKAAGGDGMAKHEFGIMEHAPQSGERYDHYEAQRYRCIAVDDSLLENRLVDFRHIDCCWHSTDVREKGLACCGITLIPPASHRAFLDALGGAAALSPLRALFRKAMEENRWIIHFGL